VTIDESWFDLHPKASKCDSRVWVSRDESRPKIPKMVPNVPKTMLLLAFTTEKKFYIEGTCKGETVNSLRYIQFIENMLSAFRKNYTLSLKQSEMIVIQDNAKPHCSKETMTFFKKKAVTLLKQPPYSPDFNQCDRWLFRYLKHEMKMKENIYTDEKDLLNDARKKLKQLSEERLKNELLKLKEHCVKVESLNGDYTTK
jgi:transposase